MTGMEVGTSPETRECLLAAAQNLFAAHGYHGASIREIVRACGVSNAALYYHFGNKQGLYFEVLREYLAAVVKELQAADAGEGTCRSRLSRVALAYATIILESKNLLQTLLRDAAQFEPEEILRLLPEMGNQIPTVLAKILEDGIGAGELRNVPTLRTGLLLLGMVNAITAQRLVTEVKTTLQDDTDLVMDILFEGIGV